MKELLSALHKVQQKIRALKKDEVNPYFNSSYVSLNTVRDTVLPVLTDNGLVVLQPTELENGQLVVRTKIVHVESGQEISSVIPVLSSSNDPQKMGSGISYARRYAILSLLFLSAEDDDGNAASNKEDGIKNNGEKGGEEVSELKKVVRKPTFKKIAKQDNTEEL